MSDYAHCECQECFEVAITSDDGSAFCWECEAAGCDGSGECEASADRAMYQEMLAAARRLGCEAGRNAAGWVEQETVGGRVSDPRKAQETAEWIVQGFEDGDPEVYNAFTPPDLSGQWADDPTPASIAEELGYSLEWDGADDCATEWLDGASEAFYAVIERDAREYLELTWPEGSEVV